MKKLYKLIILSTLIWSSASSSNEIFTNDFSAAYSSAVGERVYGISNSLFLDDNDYLQICLAIDEKNITPHIRDVFGILNDYYYADIHYSAATYNDRCRNIKINCDISPHEVRGHNYEDYNEIKRIISRYTESNNDPKACFAGLIYYYDRLTFYRFSEPWFEFLNKYPAISSTIVIANNNFDKLFERLHLAQESLDKLKNKFSKYKGSTTYNDNISLILSDIRKISTRGLELANTMNDMFETIKPIVIDYEMQLDTISERKLINKNLKSFEDDLSEISTKPDIAIDESVDQAVAAVKKALKELKKELDE